MKGYSIVYWAYLGRKKNEEKKYDFSDDDSDDVPPPPKVVKKTENKTKDKKGGKGRVIQRYAATFDASQLAPSIDNVEAPIKENTFKPPPMDFNPMDQPMTFQPEKTRSPRVSKEDLSPHIHKEKKMEKLRQDTTSLPHFEDKKSMHIEIEEDYVKFNESDNEGC